MVTIDYVERSEGNQDGILRSHNNGLRNSTMESDFIAYIMISSESLILMAQTENKKC